jgi:hypothetical protein
VRAHGALQTRQPASGANAARAPCQNCELSWAGTLLAANTHHCCYNRLTAPAHRVPAGAASRRGLHRAHPGRRARRNLRILLHARVELPELPPD